ncbi:retinol dehydrogenase 12 [Macroventuria anomochaeta]|uniref:Retinol dehydrogenase 12 n=1 Tax=Macroventuria anomochaeta TaxID=301207 RepID=A0ACB6S509_9PLEO|nr:retinol dehydrogenase 12 [Macroventuria anomochaeta]KAF2629266.1 retinol dehydrogenase 12 [Macroventuria anomochaeta]
MPSSIIGILFSQLFTSVPKPTDSYAGKTVIVTGSNIGLGLEAARHFTRLSAAKVILAVRSINKGEEAKRDIEKTTGVKNVVEVWQLDMSSYQSVLDFVTRAEKELERLDIALLNAGISAGKFEIFEKDESTITVNVVSTFLLAFALLPKLKATSVKFNTRPNLTITASEVHFATQFKEKDVPEGQIFAKLNEPTNDMQERYFVSKMMEVLVIRAMADQKSASQIPITINCVNPGYCKSAIARNSGFAVKLAQTLIQPIFARTTEEGSRTLVHAASQGAESHGQYMSNCEVAPVAPLVTSAVGYKTQNRVWAELSNKLEVIKPGVTSNL